LVVANQAFFGLHQTQPWLTILIVTDVDHKTEAPLTNRAFSLANMQIPKLKQTSQPSWGLN